MTVEEIEIIVTAKVEEAVREVMKLAPAIKEAMKQAQETLSKVDTKTMQNKFQQAVQFMKKKMQDLKKSTENSRIAIKINNKEAQQQISQLEKEINSLQKKITGRELKLNITNNTLDKIRSDTNKSVIKDMPNAGNKVIKQETYKRLDNDTNYTSLVSQSDKLNKEIIKYNTLLKEAKSKMSELGQQTSQTKAIQSKLSGFFSTFKEKLAQAKLSVENLKNVFKQMPKLTQNITNNIKNMGKGLKQGLGHILKYAGALFSLRGIYSTLSSCAQSWLSSQNAGAKQLSANIDYMKYAMGSAFAPVIQWVTNLVYQLMKAIQSVVYALFKVNIFANASAKSYGAMAGSAKKAKKETKQLAGIHDEINNIQNNDNSDSGSGSGGEVAPSFDLSNVNPSNSIIDAIKNGNWYEVGATIGQKLNEAMNSINWGQIQNTAKQIGSNIANFLNGFIAIIDWNQVGNTFAQGLNTIIYFGYSFVTTFDWKQFGTAIGNSINGFFNNIDWATAGQTLGNGIIGIFNSISSFLETVDWVAIGESVKTFIQNIDWAGIWEAIKETIKNAIGAVDGILTGLFGEDAASIIKAIAIAIGIVVIALTAWSIAQGILNAVMMMSPITWIIIAITAIIAVIILCIQHWEEICQVVSDVVNAIGEFLSNLWQGICDIFSGIGQWFSDRFTEAYNFIVGIFQGIGQWFSDRWNDICNIFNGIGQWFSDKFTEAYNSVVNIFSKVGDFFSGVWQGICNIFGNVSGWFKDKFSQAWEAVKNVFSAGGRIFDGIKDGILNGLKTVINAIIGGINKVIAIPFNGINTALRAIRSVNIMGLQPFSWINTISVPQIPKLAKGGVLYDDTIVMAGEYSGASTNPEIIAPQNIMEETFDRVLSKYQGNNNGQPIHLQMYWGSKKIVDEVIDGINEKTRQTGKLQIRYT